MAQQPHQDAHGCPGREPGPPVRIHHADIPPIIPPLLIIRRLHHRGRQIEIRERTILLRQTQPVAPPPVHRQRPRLDVYPRQPVPLRAQQRLGRPQVVVDVRRGAQQDLPEQEGHVPGEVVVDGGGGEEDDPGRLAEGAEDADDGGRGVLAQAAVGLVVVCGDDEEEGAAVADAGGEEVVVVDAAFGDGDAAGGVEAREEAEQFGFVAAVGVDASFWVL